MFIQLMQRVRFKSVFDLKLIFKECRNMALLREAHSDSNEMNKHSFETGITVYNSVVRKKVKLFTRFPKTVLWYCCGPTVYDSAHLGHARSYIHFDIIRRIMENYFGLNVVMVMNITDVDDKIIAKSNELHQPYDIVSHLYEREFFEDMTLLNIQPPSIKARVSDNIPEILDFIEKLIINGSAYVTTDGSVYFNVSKFPGYGKFAPTQETYSNDSVKQSSEDFALWKSAKPKEPFWQSPWGKGRPGWHIECSAIACKYLGQAIDIHSGGMDLKFPHHENEEAQCCARHGISQWVNCWIHTGHLFSAGNEKMSKSLKNTVSIRNFLSEYSSNILRIFCLMVPYRKGIEMRKETLEKAATIDRKISQFISDLQDVIQGEKNILLDENRLFQVLHDTEQNVIECFSDDFDTNKALNELLNLISETNSMLKSSNQDYKDNSRYCLVAIFNYLYSTLQNLGFQYATKTDLKFSGIEDIITSAVKFRSDIREAALNINKSSPKEMQDHKRYLLKTCDSVRENFLKCGVELKDHGKSTTWSYSERNVKTSVQT